MLAERPKFNILLASTEIKRPKIQPPGLPESRLPILDFRRSLNAVVDSDGLSHGQKILITSALTFASVKDFNSDPNEQPSIGTSSELHKGVYAGSTALPWFREIAPYIRSTFHVSDIPTILSPDSSSNVLAGDLKQALTVIKEGSHVMYQSSIDEPYIMRAKRGGTNNSHFTQVDIDSYSHKDKKDRFFVEEDSLQDAMILSQKNRFNVIKLDDYTDTGRIVGAMESIMQGLRAKGYAINISALVALFGKSWTGAEEYIADLYGSDFPIYIGCMFDNLWPQTGATAGGAEIRGVAEKGLTFADKGNLQEIQYGSQVLRELQQAA